MARPMFKMNDYIAGLRLRLQEGERAFDHKIKGIIAEHAQKGTLKSSGTIKRLIRGVETDYPAQIATAFDYLHEIEIHLDEEATDILSMTSSLLVDSLSAFKSIANPGRYATNGVSLRSAIEESFKRVDQLLAQRMRELALGFRNNRPISSTPPATDNSRLRYIVVDVSNRAAVTQLLEELRTTAAGLNDVADEDREIALSEIASFESTLAQPRVASDLVDRFVNKVLSWLARTFSNAAIQAIAERLIKELLPLLK